MEQSIRNRATERGLEDVQGQCVGVCVGGGGGGGGIGDGAEHPQQGHREGTGGCAGSVCGWGRGDRRWNRVSPTRTTPLIYPFPTFQLISNVIYIV